MKFIVSATADADVLVITQSLLLAGGENAAKHFLKCADTTYSSLSRWPRTGKRCRWIRGKEVRFVLLTGLPTYLVFYSVHDQFLKIERVLHGARRLKTMVQRDDFT